MRFLAYDVETANNKDIGSICSIGWVLIQNNTLIDQGYTLINPHIHFSPYNIRVHGITESDVENAPTFSQYWESTLHTLFETSVIISYSAAFDIAATEQALKNACVEDSGIDYIDFLPMCKFFLPDCQKYTLSSVAEAANVSFTHHNALEDARAMVSISKFLCARTGFDGLEELIIRSHTPLLSSLTNSYLPKTMSHQPPFSNHLPVRCSSPVEKLDDVLSGCSFCVTGDVQDKGRDEVERMILEHGGEFKTSVSRKTTFLVVGTYSDYPPGYVSGKSKKANELIEQGVPIQILSSDDFLALMQSPESDPRIIAHQKQQEALLQQAEARELKKRALQEVRKSRMVEKDASAQVQKTSHNHTVLQFSKDGELIASYESVSLASKATGINVKCIRDTAKGIQRSAGGFLWKFETEDSQSTPSLS